MGFCAWMSKRIIQRGKDDEMGMVRFFMDWLQLWPREKKSSWRTIYFWSTLLPGYMAIALQMILVAMTARTEDPLLLLQVFTDSFATMGTIYKGLRIRANAKKIQQISNTVLTEFPPLEINHVRVRIKAPRISWGPVLVYFLLCLASVAVCVLSAILLPADIRQITFKAPKFWNQYDILFYSSTIWWIYGHIGYFPTNALLDSLIICLTNLIRGKAATLQNIIRDLDKITDKTQRDIEINKIIEYHWLLIDIHGLAESIMNRIMLIQLTFLMIGIGTPSLRIFLADLETSYAIFVGIYVFWVLSQLLVYFLLCDAATTAAGRIGFSAYSAYQPGMTKDQVVKLIIVMAKAQRPLHLTARNMIKINRRTMLKLCKQSYSIYSAVLSMR